MNAPSAHVASTIAQVAASMNSSMTLDETLDSLLGDALRTLPGFSHIGISITLSSGAIETRAGTDQLVWDLDALQYSLREGPCYDAIQGGTTTVVNHLEDDQRWPHYTSEAFKKGVRSQLGVGVHDEEGPLGGLTLYSTESDTLAEEAVHAAQLFAAQVTTVLGRAREAGQFQEALFTRRLMGRLIGTLLERYEVDDEHARQFAIRASVEGNVVLRSRAEDFVSTATVRSRDAG